MNEAGNSYTTKNFLIDTLKESARVAIIAVIAILVPQLESVMSGQLQNIDYKLILVAGIIAFVKGVDKGIHKYGSNVGSETLVKGILRF